MLYLNNQEFKVPQEFVDEFKAKKKMVFKLDPKYIYYDKLNGKYRSPASVNIETITKFNDGQGNNGELRWCQNRTPRVVSGTTIFAYTPELVGFDHTRMIQVDENNIDLAYFLYVHQDNASNPKRNPAKKPHFFLENKVKAAEVNAKANKQYAKAISLIWEDDINKLRDAAKSLLMEGVDEMNDDQVRNSLDSYVKDKDGNTKRRKGQSATSLFMKSLDGADKAYRVIIQDAIDYKIIQYVNKGRNWCVVGEEDGKAVAAEVMTSVRVGENRMDALVRYFMREDSSNTLSLIKERISEAKAK